MLYSLHHIPYSTFTWVLWLLFANVAYFRAQFHNLFHTSASCLFIFTISPENVYIYIEWYIVEPEQTRRSTGRTCTQCSQSRKRARNLRIFPGFRACRDIYTISRGPSGVLANLIRLKRQIFVCLSPWPYQLAKVRGQVGRILDTRRYTAIGPHQTRPVCVCLELDDKLIACRVCHHAGVASNQSTSF